MRPLALTAALCLALAAPAAAQPATQPAAPTSANAALADLLRQVEEMRAALAAINARVAGLEERANAASLARVEGELAVLVARQTAGRCSPAAPVKLAAGGAYLLPADGGYADTVAVACHKDEAGAGRAGGRR